MKKKLTEEAVTQQRIKQVKIKLSNDLRDLLTLQSKHLNIGIFHEDVLIVEAMALMKEANMKVITISNELSTTSHFCEDGNSYTYSDELFHEEDFINFRTRSKATSDFHLNPYLEYKTKIDKIVYDLSHIYEIQITLQDKIQNCVIRINDVLLHDFYRLRKVYSPTPDIELYIIDISVENGAIFPRLICSDSEKEIIRGIKAYIEDYFIIPFYKKYNLGNYGPCVFSNKHYKTPYLEFSPREILNEFRRSLMNIRLVFK